MSNVPHVSPIDIDDPLEPKLSRREQPRKSASPAASDHDRQSLVLTTAPSSPIVAPERLERHPEAKFSVRVPAVLTHHPAMARAELTPTHGAVSVAELGAAILAEHFRDIPSSERLEQLGELLERYRANLSSESALVPPREPHGGDRQVTRA